GDVDALACPYAGASCDDHADSGRDDHPHARVDADAQSGRHAARYSDAGTPSTLTRTCTRSRSVRRRPSGVGAPCIAQRSTISGAMSSISFGSTKCTTPSVDAPGLPGTVSRTHGSLRQRRALVENPKPNRYTTPGGAMMNQVGTVPRVEPSREVTSTSSCAASASRNSAGSGVTRLQTRR